MATKFFQPLAVARAQVSTIQITAYDAATTYALSINGVVQCSTIAQGSANATATALAAAWPTTGYAAGISVAANTDTLTFTGTDEVRFTVAGSVTGGTGTVGSFSTTTTATGPHTLSDPVNWGGSLPSNSDTLRFDGLSTAVLWGADEITTTGHAIHIPQSAIGLFGLNPNALTTTADGANVNTSLPEYRPWRIAIDWVTLTIGELDSPTDRGGSRRINLHNPRSSASTTIIERTNQSANDDGRNVVELLLENAGAALDVREGASVGVGTGEGGETATCGAVTNRGRLFVGSGVTMSGAFRQFDGRAQLRLVAAGLSTGVVHAGEAIVDGSQAATMHVRGGTVHMRSTATCTVHHHNGQVDYRGSGIARSASHTLYAGAAPRVYWNANVVTLSLAVESTEMQLSAG